MDGMNWEELEEKCRGCHACPLGETRKNLVFGKGDRAAKLVFVGEAPGETEDETGIPFVGRAGKLFDLYLDAVGIARDSVYVCNILKCRPPKNRDPKPEEEDACIGYLRAQLALIRPKLVVCLGRISAMRLIRPDFRITKEHGQWFDAPDGYRICAVYHPSLLLRDPRKKEERLADMKAVRQMLEDEGQLG